MVRNSRRDSKLIAGIFGPILLLFVVLTVFQYKNYNESKARLENKLSKQQELITVLAATRMQSFVREVIWNLDKLGYSMTSIKDSSQRYEAMSKIYDSLGGRVETLAYFGADGGKVHSVSGKGGAPLPENSRFEEFFSIPKMTMVPYISPLIKFADGSQGVYITYPIKSSATNEFAGVMAARVSQSSFSALCTALGDINNQARFVYYDQFGQKVCQDAFCKGGSIGQKEMMGGSPVAETIARPSSGGGRERVRLLYQPLQLEGYRWYVSSEMPLASIDNMVRGDFIFLSVLSLLFVSSLVAGGFYFRAVYRAKARAESEAAHSGSVAAKSAAVEAEKDKLLAVLDSIPDGIMLLDGGGKVIDSNARARELLGLSPTAGRDAQCAVPDDLARSFLGPVDDDGVRAVGPRAFKIVSIPLAEGSGPVSEVRLIRDVTLEKSLEQKKADLVNMITHDIKNPISAIIGIAQWLNEDRLNCQLSEESKAGLEAVSRASNRILNLMDNFLFLSSVEGAHRLNKMPVDLNLFLSKALLEFHLDAKKKDIRIRHNLAEYSPLVPMDETQMMRAVSNLLNNALKHTPAGGEVSLNTKKFRDYVTITVSDSGPGINKDEIPSLFERYYRTGKTAKSPDGFGLGLVIVKTVVESHGGTIDVVSEEGTGSTFTVRLPLYNLSEEMFGLA